MGVWKLFRLWLGGLWVPVMPGGHEAGALGAQGGLWFKGKLGTLWAQGDLRSESNELDLGAQKGSWGPEGSGGPGCPVVPGVHGHFGGAGGTWELGK